MAEQLGPEPEPKPRTAGPSAGRLAPARQAPLRTRAQALAECQSGAVAIITALALPVLLAFAGLALEYGNILVLRAQAQRAADLASHAGAVAYARTGQADAMVDAAEGVARLNGFSGKGVVTELVSDFPPATGEAVRVTITAPRPLYLPRLVGGDASVDVAASAVAGTVGGTTACVQALAPDGEGISLSGGASLTALDCGIASNAEVDASCGASIVTESLSYNAGDDPLQEACRNIRAPDGGAPRIVRGPTPDPLEGTEAIAAAASRMAAAAALSPPEQVTVNRGQDIDFGWKEAATKAQAAAAGCQAALASSVWTLSCPGRSVVDLGDVTLGGGLRLRFNPAGRPDVTYNLSGSIRNNGAGMTFAGGAYNIAQGIFTGGGSVTEFGPGSYRIGRSKESCSGTRYSICNRGRLSFDGPSRFVLPGGVMNGGGAVLTLGTGMGNSFRFGPSSRGEAIAVGGGAQTYMGDVDDGVFEVVGDIDAGGGGGCLVLPSAENHVVNGSIIASGAVRFGSGVYAISGYMHFGGNGGGAGPCGGETISAEALEATFLISASGEAPRGGNCRDVAFCVGAGYRDLAITAPDSGPFAGLAVVGPLDPKRDAGAKFTAGARGGRVSGAFYFPNGPISLSGGASAQGTEDACLQLIGAEISISGGASAASECALPTAAGAGQVVLLG